MIWTGFGQTPWPQRDEQRLAIQVGTDAADIAAATDNRREQGVDKQSRIYARYLMAHVIPDQRWGVPAGAPRLVIVHVKNGWLPFGPGGWEINSIGAFTTAHRAYLTSVLTYDNPSMAYGVETIERIAEVIHHDLNPGDRDSDDQFIPASTPSPSWGIPDEPIPVSP